MCVDVLSVGSGCWWWDRRRSDVKNTCRLCSRGAVVWSVLFYAADKHERRPVRDTRGGRSAAHPSCLPKLCCTERFRNGKHLWPNEDEPLVFPSAVTKGWGTHWTLCAWPVNSPEAWPRLFSDCWTFPQHAPAFQSTGQKRVWKGRGWCAVWELVW